MKLYEIEFEPHPLYHVSTKTFERPSYEMVDDARTWSQTHHNSVLGLWASTFPETCSAFGPITYEIHLVEPIKRLGISYEDWFKLGTQVLDHHEDFIKLRNEILNNKVADILYILDATGSVSEVIIVNFSVIEKMTVAAGAKDKAYRLRPLKAVGHLTPPE